MVSINVEAGHLYAGYHCNTRPWKITGMAPDGSYGVDFTVKENQELADGISLGVRIADALAKAGFGIRRTLFVDDFQIEKDVRATADPWRARLFAYVGVPQYERAGFTPLQILNESDFRNTAKQVRDELRQSASAGESNNDTLKIGQGKKTREVRLSSQTDPSEPSCEVYDYVVYQSKLAKVDIVVTVLPKSYHSQQNRVKALFSLSGDLPPVIVVYFDDSALVVTVDHWNPSLTSSVVRIDQIMKDLNP